ncbi:OLC1v1017387C3 [Oldenlandia corymbosa var. corymbosa]|nr:OLC1v1017387C3 [Oldenlandia corymbosa var. corymbosa]
MSRPLHRGISGGARSPGNIHDSWEDSQMKDKADKEDVDRKTANADSSYLSIRQHFRLLFPDNSSSKQNLIENGFASDPFSPGTLRNRHKFTLFLLRLSLVVIVILALSGSFWWTLAITTSSRGQIYRGYRRLQQELVSDLVDIGKLSIGSNRLKELDYCLPESENYVPCFNVTENLALGMSKGEEYNRHCRPGSRQSCLVQPPVNYKIPLRWPWGRDLIWVANINITAQEVRSSGSLTKRMMMYDEDQISFRSASPGYDDMEDYAHQIAEMIGLRNESNFIQSGVRTMLDIGCGYGNLGAHLFSNELLTMCIANYEASGSQVQLTLERGLPAMIGSFTSKQLPYPSLSFDMIHCAGCGIDWDQKDGILLIEVDRVLRPGGYFVWTSQLASSQQFLHKKENQKEWNFVHGFAKGLCWDMLSQQVDTVVWKKTTKKSCPARSGSGPPLCSRAHDIETPYYRPLQGCVGGTQSQRWISIEERSKWPAKSRLNAKELAPHGLNSDDLAEDSLKWQSAVQNYWSLLSPLIFSDHPKRPGDEDPSPPFNMVRNVLDMNAHFGGFNMALLESKKSAWVMNVIPTTANNHLPLILDRGLVGVLHDWCEAFPTYPRTYDLVHGKGILSLEFVEKHRCEMIDVFTEIDRILRPEGWVILRDAVHLIESARALTTRLRWDARVVEIDNNSEEKLLICQKPFIKRQAI